MRDQREEMPYPSVSNFGAISTPDCRMMNRVQSADRILGGVTVTVSSSRPRQRVGITMWLPRERTCLEAIAHEDIAYLLAGNDAQLTQSQPQLA